MRLYVILSFVFFYINTFCFAQSNIVLDENFDNNNNNWWIGSDANGTFSASMSNGNYVIDRPLNQSWSLFFEPVNIDPNKNFSVECVLTQVSGVDNYGFGLIWGTKDVDNFHSLTISSNGYVNVHSKEKGVLISHKDWTKLDDGIINTIGKSNILKVEQVANGLAFYVNGTKVYSCARMKFFGNYIGFEANMQMKFLVDKVLVKQDKPPIDLLPAGNGNYKKVNLGEMINTIEVEKSPLISPDGKTLYFCREHNEQNIGGKDAKDDIWYSSIIANDKWKLSVNIGRPLNNEGFNTVVSITPDNNTMLIQNTYNPDGSQKGAGFSITHRDKSGWSLPQDVVMENFYNNASTTEAYLSGDQQTLLITLNREDSYGDKDIYVSFKQPSGRWTEPKNVGDMINTYSDEVSPFLASDNKTMYFSTAGRSGYGSNDIFVTRRLDDTWINWSTPKNLGPTVNTNDWDAYYTLPASGDYAILCTQANSIGKLDIFKIKLEEDAKPKPVVLIFGKVLNAKTKQPLEAIINYERLDNGEEVGVASSDPSSGDYKIVLPMGVNYGYHAQAQGYIAVSENMELMAIDKYTEINKDLYLVPIEIGQTIALNNIFFTQGQFNLLATSFPELDRLVKILQDNSTMEIELAGHTDNQGNAELNVKLSENRVRAVKNYLIAKGIKASRITGIGYGGAKPIADNSREQTRKLNRRVEFRITK